MDDKKNDPQNRILDIASVFAEFIDVCDKKLENEKKKKTERTVKNENKL